MGLCRFRTLLIDLRLVPESVRWLLAKNNIQKAEKVIRKAAVVNGVVLSDNILNSFEIAPHSNEVTIVNL